jgi:hypothetical protein
VSRRDFSELPLPALLARVLLAFALEFEHESGLSLAIGANVLRVVEEQGTAVRKIPARRRVSKEAVTVALLPDKARPCHHHERSSHSPCKEGSADTWGVQAYAGYPRLL